MAIISEEDECGVLRETRDYPPSDYLFKIQSLSLYLECDYGEIESGEFVAGGHKWKIGFFPNGENEKEYVSIYLSFADTSCLVDGEEVPAICRFFLFDQVRGNYLTVQGKVRRFDSVKYEWGLSKFISLQEFKDPTNGFLVDDTCVVGAEVNVIGSAGPRECLSISKLENVMYNYTWKLNQFSTLVDDECFSDEFDVGSYKWRLDLYRNGDPDNRGCSLSLYLELINPPSNSSAEYVKAEYTITLKDQINMKHHIMEDNTWFGPSDSEVHGWGSFIQLEELKDRTKGFIVDDCCEFEAQLKLLCRTQLKPLNSRLPEHAAGNYFLLGELISIYLSICKTTIVS